MHMESRGCILTHNLRRYSILGHEQQPTPQGALLPAGKYSVCAVLTAGGRAELTLGVSSEGVRLKPIPARAASKVFLAFLVEPAPTPRSANSASSLRSSSDFMVSWILPPAILRTLTPCTRPACLVLWPSSTQVSAQAYKGSPVPHSKPVCRELEGACVAKCQTWGSFLFCW